MGAGTVGQSDARWCFLGDCSAVLLAGGLGTRLRPAFHRGPKCLAPVGPRPFLDYLLNWLWRQGTEEVTLCVGYRRSQIQRRYGTGSRWGLKLNYAIESAPLGTAGALRNARKFLSSASFFVLNGDSFLDIDLMEMLTFHHRRQALATVALVRSRTPGRYGAAAMDRAGRITKFREKQPSSDGARPEEWINGGVYLMRKEMIDRIPRATPSSLETDIFPALVGRQLFGFPTEGFFIDIGTPRDYRRAQKELPERCPDVHPR